MSKIIDFFTTGIDKIEDSLTNYSVENTAKKYTNEFLAQRIKNDLKPDQVKSCIHNLRRYRSDDGKWVKNTAEILKKPEIINIINAYDGETAINVMKVLGNYTIRNYIKEQLKGPTPNVDEICQTLKRVADKTTEPNATEIISRHQEYNPKYSWHIAENLAGIFLNIRDEEISNYITDTIKHYDGIPAISISELSKMFLIPDKNAFDIESAKIFYEIMTMDEVIEACNKYNTGKATYLRRPDGKTGYSSSDTNNGWRIYKVVEALTETAMSLKDKETTKLAAKVISKFDKKNVEPFADQIYQISNDRDKAEYLPSILNSINKIYPNNPITSETIGINAAKIIEVLGKKTDIFLEYAIENDNKDNFFLREIISLKHPETIGQLITEIDTATVTKELIPHLVGYASITDENIKHNLYPAPPKDLVEAEKNALSSKRIREPPSSKKTSDAR